MYTAQVITVSDRSFRGERPDGSGPVVRSLLEAAGYQVGDVVIVPDEQPLIEQALIRAAEADIAELDMALLDAEYENITGGTDDE